MRPMLMASQQEQMPTSCLEDGISSHVNLFKDPFSNCSQHMCSSPPATMSWLLFLHTILPLCPIMRWMVGLQGWSTCPGTVWVYGLW